MGTRVAIEEPEEDASGSPAIEGSVARDPEEAGLRKALVNLELRLVRVCLDETCPVWREGMA